MLLLSDKPRAALLCCPSLLEPRECPCSRCHRGSGVGAARVWPGQMPAGGLALWGDGDAEGARGFPKVLVGANFSWLAPRCSARGTLKVEQPAGSWQCPAPPVQSKGPCSGSRSCGGAEGVFRVDEMHAHTHPRQTHDGSCYASDPKALRDPPV